MSVELILPSAAYERSYVDYIKALHDEVRYPFPLDFAYQDFNALLSRLKNLADGLNLPEEFVPSTTYWLVKGDELVGVSNLRHHLNDQIRYCGGHIGLGVRRKYRGQGLGAKLTALTLKRAAARGIGEIHMHCYKTMWHRRE